MAQPQLKLIYFDIPGKAEAIRLALYFQDLKFEDYRFKDREEFMAMKTSGELPFGQVPALLVDGNMLIQSAAILRYVGKLGKSWKSWGLYPDDPILAARVDAIVDQEADAFVGVRVANYKERFGFAHLAEDEGALASVWKAQYEEIIPRHLGQLQQQLDASATGWLAGTQGPSIADFFWVPSLMALQKGRSGDADVLKAFPRLEALVGRFLALPKIAEYYQNRS